MPGPKSAELLEEEAVLAPPPPPAASSTMALELLLLLLLAPPAAAARRASSAFRAAVRLAPSTALSSALQKGSRSHLSTGKDTALRILQGLPAEPPPSKPCSVVSLLKKNRII